jgi:hypothetical protein
MHTKDDVKQLLDHIGESKIEPGVETDVSQFGLGAHLFDPISGEIITVAQPQTSGGQPQVLLTAEQAVHAVGVARTAHLQKIRADGFASLDDFNARQAQATVARDLAHKQAMERENLAAEQSEAAAKAAADAAPKKAAAVVDEPKNAQGRIPDETMKGERV